MAMGYYNIDKCFHFDDDAIQYLTGDSVTDIDVHIDSSLQCDVILTVILNEFDTFVHLLCYSSINDYITSV